MAGFQSPNHTQIPNDLFDEYLSKLGHAELKILLAILRYTLGFHKKKKRMSITSIQKITGLARSSVQSGCASLVETGLVTRVKDGGVTQWIVNWADDPPDMGVLDVPDTGIGVQSVPNKDTHYTGNRAYSIPDIGTPSNKENIKENIKEIKDSSAEKQTDNGRPPKAEYNRLRKLAEDTWYEITKCPQLTNEKAKYKRVYAPLLEILDMVKWNEDNMFGLLYATYDRMKDLTFDAPDQWVKTARSIVGKANDGTYKPKYSFQAEMNKFLEGSRDGK